MVDTIKDNPKIHEMYVIEIRRLVVETFIRNNRIKMFTPFESGSPFSGTGSGVSIIYRVHSDFGSKLWFWARERSYGGDVVLHHLILLTVELRR